MGDSWEYEWHVIEGLSVDGIVNIDFIKFHDVFGNYDYTLVDHELCKRGSEIFGICELPGGSAELSNLADEFISDCKYLPNLLVTYIH